MSKKLVSLLLAVCMVVSFIPSTVLAVSGSSLPFTDVESNAWYYESVEYVYTNGLMNGIDTNLFAPKKDLTRAMFVTILGRLDGVDTSNYTSSSFIDVVTGLWYSPYVEWASDKNIVTGYEDGTFRPNQAITREQMATIIARYVDVNGITLSNSSSAVSSFKDISSVRAYALEGLELIRSSGIITGDEYGNFNPNKTASRAEVTAVVMRLVNAMNSNRSSSDSSYDSDDTVRASTSSRSSSNRSSSSEAGLGNNSGNGTSNNNLEIYFDDDDYTSNENYVVLNGTYLAENGVLSISYLALSDYSERTGTIEYDEYKTSWCLNQVRLFSGKNTISVTITDKKGYQSTNILTIYFDSGTSYELNEENIVWTNQEKTSGYVNNIIIVNFENGLSEAEKLEIAMSIDRYINVAGRINSMNQFHIQIDPVDTIDELRDLCNTVMGISGVEFAHYDTISSTQVEPNDPWRDVFQGSMGMDWDESNPSGYNWWAEAVNLPSAWDYNSQTQKIKVGIVDNGFDSAHEDLDLTIIDIFNNNVYNHGTHIAGIIGATANNNLGITGILWNKDLFCIDVFQSETKVRFIDKMKGIESLLAVGVKVVNLSNGRTLSTEQEIIESAYWAIYYIDKLIEEYGEDFILVQAAGNEKIDALKNGFLCSLTNDTINAVRQQYGDTLNEREITNFNTILDHCIVVGGVELDTSSSSYKLFTKTTAIGISGGSNYGSSITVCAPGKDIFSTLVSGGITGSYGNLTGTSMAAPIVTGITALVWSVNPTLSAREVKQIIVDTATTPVESNVLSDTNTYFMINAYEAVKNAAGETAKKIIQRGTTLDLTAESVTYGSFSYNPKIQNIFAVNEGWTWYATATDGYPAKTLILNGVEFSTKAGVALVVPSKTTIILADGSVNRIADSGSNDLHSYGIHCKGDLTITGNGELNISAGKSVYGVSRGLCVSGPGNSNLTINGGTISVLADNAHNGSFGIYIAPYSDYYQSEANLSINAGTLTTSGGAVESGYSTGIYIQDNITVNGGSIDSTGRDNCIYSRGTVNSNDATIKGLKDIITLELLGDVVYKSVTDNISTYNTYVLSSDNETIAKRVVISSTSEESTHTELNSEISTGETAITPDEAIGLCKSVFGTINEETGYNLGYVFNEICTYEGINYYAIRCTWQVKNEAGVSLNSSYIGHLFVRTDGKLIYNGENYGGTFNFYSIVYSA